MASQVVLEEIGADCRGDGPCAIVCNYVQKSVTVCNILQQYVSVCNSVTVVVTACDKYVTWVLAVSVRRESAA